jgi:RHS repeat-associated protein
MIRPSNRASIRNISDYSPFGVQLSERTISSDGYRYGFQGQEGDDEISGSANSIDFGNRMYDPRLGKFFSLDAFASKYPSTSPYAFVVNNPIGNIEMGGDSVLFYSASGTYLGYSHDNVRYKDKNLLVVIEDKDVKNFKNQYQRKRILPNLSRAQKEAHVAGLEGMGTSFDVTDFFIFYNQQKDKIEKNGTEVVKGEKAFEVEWAAKMYIDKSNPLDKGGSFAVDESTKTTDNNKESVTLPMKNSGIRGDFHTHPDDALLKPSDSPDWPRASVTGGAWSVITSGAWFEIYKVDPETKERSTIQINKSEFKSPTGN